MAAAAPAAAAAATSGRGKAIQQTATTQRLTFEPYTTYQLWRARYYVKSAEFTMAGHRWVIVYYPSGSDETPSTYASVFLRLESNLLPADHLRVAVDFALVDRSGGGEGGYKRCVSHVFVPGAQRHCGLAEYVPQRDLGAGGCLEHLTAGDRLVLECTVRLAVDGEELPRVPAPAALPAGDLLCGLRGMLEDGAWSDVTVVVRGRPFRAHRCVLAARSEVFKKALLWQPARSPPPTPPGEPAMSIPVDDMEPEVFAAMLRFIYEDALPPRRDDVADAHMAQHLLAAADVYGLSALTRACQDRLRECVTPATAADTYALAVELNLGRLKDAVVESVAGCGEGLESVKASEGFRVMEVANADAAREMVGKVEAAAARARMRQGLRTVSSGEIAMAWLGITVVAGLALAAITVVGCGQGDE